MHFLRGFSIATTTKLKLNDSNGKKQLKLDHQVLIVDEVGTIRNASQWKLIRDQGHIS